MDDDVEKRARELFASGEPAKAIALMEQLATAQPDDGRLAFLLGDLYARVGNFERAAERLRAAAVVAPDLWHVRDQLGLAMIRVPGCERDGCEQLRRAAELQPDFETLMNHATACAMVDDMTSAETSATRAAALEPRSPHAVAILAACAAARNDVVRRDDLVRKTRSLLRSHPPPPEMVEMIEDVLARAG